MLMAPCQLSLPGAISKAFLAQETKPRKRGPSQALQPSHCVGGNPHSLFLLTTPSLSPASSIPPPPLPHAFFPRSSANRHQITTPLFLGPVAAAPPPLPGFSPATFGVAVTASLWGQQFLSPALKWGNFWLGPRAVSFLSVHFLPG